jgi:glycosyltransferase involved in cell wall biosynthesis
VPGAVSPIIERRQIHRSFVQRLPFARRFYRQYLPFFPAAIEQFDFDRFDMVVSISHCAAKSIVRPPRARHLCYCLTPMRYAWDQFDAYFGPERIGAVASRVMRRAMARLAKWDRDTADRVDRYVAISHHVAGRIARYYNRDAIVVYPPVDTDFYYPDMAPSADFYALVASALVPYKRIEVAIEACRRARIPLKIAGDGPDRSRLQRLGGSDVEFLGRVSNDALRALYRRASVVLLPGQEDFGIVPLEAQACGRPVVALGRGGALETVRHEETGVLVDDVEPDAFASAIHTVLAGKFEPPVIRRHAERFGRKRFGDEMEALIVRELSGVSDVPPRVHHPELDRSR